MFPVWNEQCWLLTDVFAYRVVGWCLPCGRARQRRQAGQCLALLLPSLTGPRCIEPSSTSSTHRHHPAADGQPPHTKRPHFTPSATELDILGKHKYFWCPDTNIFAPPGVVCGSQPCGAGVQCWSKFFVWDINWILTFLPWYRYWGWGCGGGRCSLDRTMNLGFGRVFLTLLPSFYRIFPFRFTSTESNNSIVFLTTGKKG